MGVFLIIYHAYFSVGYKLWLFFLYLSSLFPASMLSAFFVSPTRPSVMLETLKIEDVSKP